MDTSTQQLCPLCNKPNGCALANDKEASQCWCMSVKINAEALAKLKTPQKNFACICQQCASVPEAK
ncbi:cysteine-rich CWC family protein [Cellvibrio zantedeschiae]|uniref:cysteine-rich CWC family protein n=1 Tax=Cellvibrio zantedeschiae TaxID=1237077 RepID=UPI00167977D1